MQRAELSLDRTLVADLRRATKGTVIVPGDAAYDAARAVYFSSIDRRPGVIVRPADGADVGRVVELARTSGSELAVKNGGHSPAAHGVQDGGIMLDLSTLADFHIDVPGRIARAGAGLAAGAYTAAAGAHGLATGFGDAPSVGIGGITLAGGVGFLHRRYGLTIDSVLAAEIVTADGRLRRVDAVSDPDLFWAIRGGGGNFGIVTRLEYRLHQVSSVLGGMLMLPATPARIVAFLAAAMAAPDELSLIMHIAPAPPVPFIPAEQHGRPAIMAMLVYAGDGAAGERALAPFRALGPPLADLVRPMRYPEVYESEAGAPHPVCIAIRTGFADALDVSAAEAIMAGLQRSTAPMRVVQFRPLGGAVARVPAGATAFAHRARGCVVNVAAMYEHPEERAEHVAWVTETAAALGGSPGAYVGFMSADDAARIGEAYPGGTGKRLAALKARYDPGNVFRSNHNITAALAG